MTPFVASVNIGSIAKVPWGSVKRSAIDKRPVSDPVQVEALGLVGDEIGDTKHHGGLDQAVYAFAGEDLDYWSQRLGREMTPGRFGENLTTRGLDVTDAHLGERWQIGEAVLEVCSVRIPCSVFAGFLDEKLLVKHFTEVARPGAYLRVITPGRISPGDEVRVVEGRDHDITVGVMFRALTTERVLLPRLLDEPRIAAKERAKVEKAASATRE